MKKTVVFQATFLELSHLERNINVHLMKNLLIFCLLLFAFMSCDQDNEVSQKNEIDYAPVLNYFPLNIGNEWEFELRGKREVVQIQSLNGQAYFEMLNDYETSRFYRVKNDKVYVISQALTNKEEMIFDLAAEVNTSWNYGPGKVTLADREASVSIGDIVIDNCLMFNFHNDNLIDYGGTVWLAPGIGFIQETCQECFGEAYALMQLKSVVINGKKEAYN
ncbi:hypothetical protein ACXR6G_16540 [Ancylomarina sp. YFZ004]